MNFTIRKNLALLLLPLILALSMGSIYFLPKRGDIAPSSLTMKLPVEYELPGWYGEKKQESELERKILAADTKFSKANYYNTSLGFKAKALACHVSIVLSGDDMNSSIHRPELCLPSQGHFNLLSNARTLELNNGKTITLTKLESQINISPDSKKPQLLNSINYYVFVGDGNITHNHIMRVLLDMDKRILHGQDQRWAYIQFGVYYGNLIGTTKQEAEEETEKLIKSLLPRIIKWDEIKS